MNLLPHKLKMWWKMGFSLTGTQVIFFVASLIVASAVSGVFVVVINNISTSLSERGDRVQDQLDYEFTIINDPDNIPSEGSNYLFYMKNIGGKKLSTTNNTFTIFIDGEIVVTANFNFSDDTLSTDDVTTMYVSTSVISNGDHTLRVVGPQAVDDEFTFTI